MGDPMPLQTPPPASENVPRAKPPGRFNDWGQRAYMVVAPDHAAIVEPEVAAMALTARARQMIRAAKLTQSAGYEFVFLSNAQFPEPLELDSGRMQIVPCFRPFPMQGGGMADMNQMAMMRKGRFVYDGWMPDQVLSPSTAESAVIQLDATTGAVSLVGSYYAHWEPKYFARDPVPSFIVSAGEVSSFKDALTAIASMPPADATALRRTIGWLSSAASSNSPVAAFLAYFVALESMVTYIETRALPDSPLATFARERSTPTMRREASSQCITEKLAHPTDLIETIKEAYFECIIGTRGLLEEHLKRVLPNHPSVGVLFKRRPAADSLWGIRGRIAHGDLNLLSETDVLFVMTSLPALEDLVRSYVVAVVSRATHSAFFSRRRRPALSFSAAEGYGAPGTVYRGPTSMAEIYLGTQDLEGPHVEITFD